MINYENFSAWYPGRRLPLVVISESDFVLTEKTITALTGLNGSGKTTLIKSILGLNPFCSGKMTYGDSVKDFLNLSKLFEIGYSPEISSSSINLTPNEIFAFGNLLSNQKSHGASVFSVKEISTTFDLLEYSKIPFSKLSKGTKKRVLIANAMLNEPKLLVLDEPFEGLDQSQRNRLKNILIEFKKVGTILISSHELLELESFCDSFLQVENSNLRSL